MADVVRDQHRAHRDENLAADHDRAAGVDERLVADVRRGRRHEVRLRVVGAASADVRRRRRKCPRPDERAPASEPKPVGELRQRADAERLLAHDRAVVARSRRRRRARSAPRDDHRPLAERDVLADRGAVPAVETRAALRTGGRGTRPDRREARPGTWDRATPTDAIERERLPAATHVRPRSRRAMAVRARTRPESPSRRSGPDVLGRDESPSWNRAQLDSVLGRELDRLPGCLSRSVLRRVSAAPLRPKRACGRRARLRRRRSTAILPPSSTSCARPGEVAERPLAGRLDLDRRLRRLDHADRLALADRLARRRRATRRAAPTRCLRPRG